MPFSEKTLDFLLENKLHDSKDWYDSHKDDYKNFVIKPMSELVEALTPAMLDIDSLFITEPKVGKTLSRVRRDTRFTNDKSLYRDTAWLVFIRDKKLFPCYPGFFFELSPRGFRYGCGYLEQDKNSLSAMREMILKSDAAFNEAYGAYKNQSIFTLVGDKYKRSKYPEQSVELQDWLDRKYIDFIRDSKDFELLFSDELTDIVAKDLVLLEPEYYFLLKAEERKTSLTGGC